MSTRQPYWVVGCVTCVSPRGGHAHVIGPGGMMVDEHFYYENPEELARMLNDAYRAGQHAARKRCCCASESRT